MHANKISVNITAKDKSKINIGTLQTAQVINNNYFNYYHTSSLSRNKEQFVWNIPSPALSFIKREKLAHLENELDNQPIGQHYPLIVITGAPGVGKTQSAYQYAVAYHPQKDATKKYPGGAFLFNAENKLSLFESYKELACHLNLLETNRVKDFQFNQKNQDEIVGAVHKELLLYPPMLLVFDNAQDSNEIKEFLPTMEGATRSLSPHHIIVTSHNNYWPDNKRIHLDNYSITEAANYIRKVFFDHAIAEPTDNLITALSRPPFNYPLALSVTMKTIVNDELISISRYITNRDITNNVDQASLDDRQKTFRTTWHLALEKLKESKPEYKDQIDVFFKLAACLKPAKISFEILHQYYFKKFGWSAEATNELIKMCLRYELLELSTIESEKDSILLHQVFYEVLQFEFNRIENTLGDLIDFILNDLFYNQFNSESIAIWTKLHAHVDYMLKKYPTFSPEKMLLLKINLIGYYVFEQTDYAHAEKLCKEIVNDDLEKLPINYQGQYLLSYLVSTCSSGRRLENEVMPNLKKAKSFFAQQNDIDSVLSIISLTNIESVYFSLWRKPDESLQALEQSLSLFSINIAKLDIQENFGHFRLYLRIHFFKGKLFLQHDKYDEAKDIFNVILNLIDHHQTDKIHSCHHYYVYALLFIAHIETNYGQFDKAKNYFLQAKILLAHRKIMPMWHIWNKCHYYVDIGNLHYLQGNYVLSAAYYRLAQNILDKIHGEKLDLGVLENLFNMTEATLAVGNLTSVAQQIEKMHLIWNSIYEGQQENLTKAKILLFQGWHKDQQKKPEEARANLEMSADIFKKLNSNRYYGHALLLLGDLSSRQMKYQQAVHYLNSSLMHLPANSILLKNAQEKLKKTKHELLWLVGISIAIVCIFAQPLFKKKFNALCLRLKL